MSMLPKCAAMRRDGRQCLDRQHRAHRPNRLRLHGLKHFTVNIVSTIDGDTARSSSHLQLVATGTKGAHILFTGRYEDELRRVNGQWLFSRRTLHQDMPLPAKAAAGS